jgi:hypothetical protein
MRGQGVDEVVVLLHDDELPWYAQGVDAAYTSVGIKPHR